MTKEEALLFINKWSEVEKIHIREVRALTPRERLRQLDSLYSFGALISDVKAESPEETLIVFANMNKLRELHERGSF